MIRVIQPKKDQEESIKARATKKVLAKLKHKEEEQEASDFARELGYPYIDTNIFPVSTESIKTLKEEDARKYQVAVIQKIGRKVTFATTNPADPETKKFIDGASSENGWSGNTFVVSKTNMEHILDKYKNVVFASLIDELNINLNEEDIERFEKELQDLINLKNRIKEIPTTQVLNVVMSGAYKLGASDVHIEPQEKEIRLRYRIDGVLHDVVDLPLNVLKPIISRIKMMSGMKLNIRDVAQDGTFEIKLSDRKLDIRVSILPGNFGETIVMRLLDPTSIQVDLNNLGLRGLAFEKIQKEINAPDGMILTTGPTGSGKTTTLYAIINKLNNPEKKIITIEDPIEYEVKGISQSQVEKSRGYTFAKGLRAIVRQDPDVILVGEIRDDETADIAVNSALTGHLVLSTIHTNNSVATIPRLIEMGVKPNLIPPSVNAIVGQRLVRKLCPHCKEEYQIAKESLDSIKKILSIISPKAKLDIPKNITKLYRPKGCIQCNNIGYKGRVGIFEVLTINDEMEKLILNMASKSELVMNALESGIVTMLQDGILKAVEGITTVEEVKRVTGEGDFLEGLYENLMSQVFSRKIIVDKETYGAISEAVKKPEGLEKLIKSAKTKDINKLIFAASLVMRAGDIHLEPGENEIHVRFRIDGILQTVASFAPEEYPSILGEIKILSGVKTEVRQGVVDSRFGIEIGEGIEDIKDSKVDIRVSIILGGYGETVVMRLLNQGAISVDMEKLGIREENLKKIELEMQKPNGMILNTGPTGSGKTTTLYSILSKLNKPDVKIITVEDPIEYQLEGILQTPVNDKEGYTFATALRSLLRQNPDILMIGEIRDDETAQIATQSSLTGHLVLSTLHTNNASASVQRLNNMGVSLSDIASSANAFMAQRLVRKLCDCKEESSLAPEEKSKIESVLKTISPNSGVKIPPIGKIYRPKGCPKCNNLGYKGRETVSEVLEMTREMQDIVNQGATPGQIQDKAVEEGMITMAQDGVLKVLEGKTTLEEVERVTEI